MSGTYASSTQVSSDRSITEISKTVRRYGADQFAFMEGTDSAAVAFVMHNRQVRFRMVLPDRQAAQFTRTPTGKTRTQNAALEAYEQAVRQRWRALALVVKAKLEAVETGITTFEQEFFAQLVLPEGDTVYERVAPAVEQAYVGHGAALLSITQGAA